MTYSTDRKHMKKNMGKELDKGFGIDKKSKDRAIMNDFVIDCNLRGKDGIKGGEPKMKKK